MVEVAVGADLIGHSDVLHIENFGSRQLVSVLDRALANLLVADRAVHDALHCLVVASLAEELVSLVSVLVALCT